MGNYQICDYCGNLHVKTVKKMCGDCERNYNKIHDMIVEHGNRTVLDISNHTGVSVRKILTFVERGFFIMKEGTIEENK